MVWGKNWSLAIIVLMIKQVFQQFWKIQSLVLFTLLPQKILTNWSETIC